REPGVFLSLFRHLPHLNLSLLQSLRAFLLSRFRVLSPGVPGKRGPMRSYGFGIIGAGVIAPTHCKAIQAIPNARLVSVCDLERSRADALAMRFGARHVCTDVRELLERDDV